MGSSINPSEQQSVGTNWASLSNGGGLQGAFGVNTTAPSGSSSVPDETNLINSNIFATIGATQGLRSSRADDPVSRRALLVDYYKYLYRFIPVMPPPSQLDASAATMSASSPFLLALQCVLPLLQDEEQPPGPLHGLAGGRLNFGTAEKKHRVREITQYFERMATEAIDKVLEREDSERGGEGTLEVIQALCVLTIYEVSRISSSARSYLSLTKYSFSGPVRKRTRSQGAPKG